MSKDKNKKTNEQGASTPPAATQQAGNSTQPPAKKPSIQQRLPEGVKPVFPKGPGVHIRTGDDTFKKVKPAKSGDDTKSDEAGDQ